MDRWHQANVAFQDWNLAEPAALAHVCPVLAAAEKDGLISAWFFIRKHPCWRVRYQPSTRDGQAQARIERHLDELAAASRIGGWRRAVYEPESHAFGGTQAMAAAHRLFHADSRHLLTRLASQNIAAPDRTRELALILMVVMLRGAGLDWYEQGDVWARVAIHRPNPGQPYAGQQLDSVRRYLTADTEAALGGGSPLAVAPGWGQDFGTAGADLAMLSSAGLLHRGLRAVLAHHVIFTWNRHGLPYDIQALLASRARDAVFGADPTAQQDHRRGEAR
jgi:thiopeptide-type bacteriocin biosynthesis protein